MTTALYIALWSYLYTVPLSEAGEVFGWLKKRLYRLPDWLFKPLIGCAKCHAGQVAFWWQVWTWHTGGGFDIPFILIAIAGAYALTTWHLIVDKWLNR